MKFIQLSIIILFSLSSLIAQDSLAINAKLLSLGKDMTTNDTFELRIKSSDVFESELTRLINAKDENKINWDSISMVLKTVSDDSLVTIYSWQIMNEGFMNYYTLIQKDDKVSKLKTFQPIINFDEYSKIDKNDWPGGLVYKIQKIQNELGESYLLFNYNYGYNNISYKFLDILIFTSTGDIEFGAPVFREAGETISNGLFRYVLKYNKEARIKLNYDDYWEQIIFDHLVETKSNYGAEQQTQSVPDGTYESFTIVDGYLIHNKKVFNKTLESAPRPNPVFTGKKDKNIFGN